MDFKICVIRQFFNVNIFDKTNRIVRLKLTFDLKAPMTFFKFIADLEIMCVCVCVCVCVRARALENRTGGA